MPRPCHFDLTADEPQRAIRFYKDVFGWKFAKKVQEKGGKVLMPKMTIPTVGWFATCQDTEGNTFGIIEFDKKAK